MRRSLTFEYDPFGKRIEKSSGTSTTIFAYDGDNLVEETNVSGSVVAVYAQGEHVDEPLAMLRSSAVSFYNSDGLGSVISLSNFAGALVQTYTYNAFGTSIGTTGSITNPFRYTGREYDVETGLYFYRARYYDSSSGTFKSEDPVRFAGSSDFYRYAQNRPVDAVDPTGLKILICSRPAEHMPGNHGFLYDTRNGHNCGKGSGNNPNGHDGPGSQGTFCTEVPGSDGAEDNVMNCCIKSAGSFSGRFVWFPWVHDCQNLAGDCLTANGLKNPGVPGGRLGCPGDCPPPTPSPYSPNPPRCAGFTCLDNR